MITSKYLILICSFLVVLAQGSIVQHAYLQDVFTYVDLYKDKKNIFIFFDVDDTILSTAHGSRITVEKTTKAIIDNLKEQGCMVHGLTARSIHQCRATHNLLQAVGVLLHAYHDVPVLHGSQDVGYHEGVFYCGAVPKGYVLKQLFNRSAGNKDIGIIFIDDLRHESVGKVAQELNLDCVSIHYTHAAQFIYKS